MGWVLKVQNQDGTTDTEEFDDDELGTLDDMLTGLFILGLDGVDQLTIARRVMAEEEGK
jgi:hypothetical protein